MEKSPPRSYKKQQKNLNELTNQELKRKKLYLTPKILNNHQS
jgi:hypothetical protein